MLEPVRRYTMLFWLGRYTYDLLGTIVMIKVSVPYFVITFYCVPLLLTAHSGLDGKSKGYLNNYLISIYYTEKPKVQESV